MFQSTSGIFQRMTFYKAKKETKLNIFSKFFCFQQPLDMNEENSSWTYKQQNSNYIKG